VARKKARPLDAVRLERLAVDYVPIDAVHPNAYNPNRQAEHEFSLLIASMRDDGFTQPVIALRKGGEIVDGEHRWRAAHAIGYKTIPVVYVDMTPEQMRVATLRHNRARGSEDAELAAVLLSDLQKLVPTEDMAVSLGLSVSEIDQLVADFSDPQVLEDASVLAAEASGDTSAIQDARRDAATRLDGQREAERVGSLGADNDIYRVILTLTNAEAIDVRAVLEPDPSSNLLAICREEAARAVTT
jgi:ParB/RepB/Spo0J family partition protein